MNAIKYAIKFVNQVYAEAQNKTGMRFYNGEGVKKNYEKAVECFEKSSKTRTRKSTV